LLTLFIASCSRTSIGTISNEVSVNGSTVKSTLTFHVGGFRYTEVFSGSSWLVVTRTDGEAFDSKDLVKSVGKNTTISVNGLTINRKTLEGAIVETKKECDAGCEEMYLKFER
jgi:hypothetical protein